MTTSIDTTIRLAALALAAFALPIRAATFTVGGGTDGRTCDFGSLQEAVDAAAAAAGPDTIRITRSLGADVGGIVVHDDAPLQLEGGYESCLDPVADRAGTVLDFGSAVGIRHEAPPRSRSAGSTSPRMRRSSSAPAAAASTWSIPQSTTRTISPASSPRGMAR